MKILAEISTHIIKEIDGQIKVYIKDIEDLNTMQVVEKHVYNLCDESQVFEHIETLKENNRILFNDFKNEML